MRRLPHIRLIHLHTVFFVFLALLAMVIILPNAYAGTVPDPSVSMTRVLNVPAHYATINQAFMFAQDGDTILVGPGIYHESILFQGKNVVLKSSDGPFVTKITVNLNQNVVVFDNKETRAAVLQGFTIEGP